MGDGGRGDRFRFRIDDVFTITGRGTVVAGSSCRARCGSAIVSGSFAATGPKARVVVCRSVEFAGRSGWWPGDPVTVGLIVPDLSRHDAVR